MIVETLRLLKVWLSDSTNGAQAQINLVPREAGDAAPPTLAAIVEETSDEKVATEDGVPSSLPALGLIARLVGEAPDPAMNDVGDGTIDVVIRYLTKDNNAATATRDAAYSLRGVIWSLRKFHQGSNDASRVLRGIQLIRVVRIELMTLYQPLGDGFVSGAVNLSYIYRDYELSL